MAESAVSLVIDKLFPLLTNEANLLRGIDKQVEDIRKELESMQSFLKDADIKVDQRNVDSSLKTWVKQVQELAFQIEDVIDEYMVHVANHRNQKDFLQKLIHLVRKLKSRHRIASEIQNLKKSVRDASERRVNYNLNSSSCSSDNAAGDDNKWHDPRMASLFLEESELVGIEAPRNELVSRLVEGPSKNVVISVVGMGGLGKTTLAKKVYDDQRVTTAFTYRARITMSQSYKEEQVLRNIIKEFHNLSKDNAHNLSKDNALLDGIETMDVEKLIDRLRGYLKEKRYVVFLDDVWNVDSWDFIKHALPDNDKGSRVLVTTRNAEIFSPSYVYELPLLSSDKSLELFYKKVFQSDGGNCPEHLQELSSAIVERCGGLPLAIVTIGGVLATKDPSMSEWQKLLDGLGSELESGERIAKITRVLSLSFHELPSDLKNCFLYFAMFPEDKFISCSRLIRLWIAEGFIKEKPGVSLEDNAQEYLTKLIHRSLVQVASVDTDGKVRTCRIHDLLLQFINSQSGKKGFHRNVLMDNLTNPEGNGRRLSIRDQGKYDEPENISNFKTRSVLLFSMRELPKPLNGTIFKSLKLLKVLDFEGAPIHNIPEGLSNLLCLNYLSLKDTKVEKLPSSIGKLHSLMTLDLRMCPVNELLIEINTFTKLRHLLSYVYDMDSKFSINSVCGLKLQGSIRCLKALQKLRHIEVDDETGLIRDLENLTELRTLGIIKLRRENGRLLCAALSKMSHLCSLAIASVSEEEFIDLQSITDPPPMLRRLYLWGPLVQLPRWISKLKELVKIILLSSRLEEDPLPLLQFLPNLMLMRLREAYNGEQMHFKKGCFHKLKELYIADWSRLKMVAIEEGALQCVEEIYMEGVPKLKELPSGIHSLRNLRTLKLQDIQRDLALRMLPDGGEDYWMIKHIPIVLFGYTTHGQYGNYFMLDDPDLTEYLKKGQQPGF